MIPHRQLASLGVVADMLGVHHKTLRKWVAEGRVPAYRVAGHTLRLDPAEVQEALLRPVTSTVHPAARVVAERKPAAPVTEAERRARVQAAARRRERKRT